jgi:hypothetical protein
MNIARLASLAAAFVITASQWALCLAFFFYTQPVTAVVPQVADGTSQSAIPEIVVIGHRS